MKLKSTIILAGGFGTRLQSVVKDVPKPMADINGIPFLEYVFRYLKKYEFENVVLSVGYLNEIIIDHFGEEFLGIKIKYSIEDEPLGTGGGIKTSMDLIDDDHVLVLNGDTFFDVDLFDYYELFVQSNSELALALKPMKDFDRYGTVCYDENNRINSFNEKQFMEKGDINGGVYIFSKNVFHNLNLPEKFSLETEVFEKEINNLKFYAYISEGYFIDIGIPEDYEKAQKDFIENGY